MNEHRRITRSVSIPTEVVERVEQAAKEDHRSFSSMAEVLLRRALSTSAPQADDNPDKEDAA